MATAAFVAAAVAACTPTPGPSPTQPRVLDVSLGPAEATVATPLVATGVGFDPLGARVVLSFAWEATDGAGITRTLARTSTPTLEAGHRKGDLVRVVVSADADGRAAEPVASSAVRVVNTPPVAPPVAIAPDVARAWLHDLVCRPRAEATDADGDPLAWTFAWTQDGEPVTAGLATTTHPGDTVPASLLRQGQVWRCTASLSDGEASVSPAVAARTIEVGVEPLIGFPVAGGSFTCMLGGDRRATCWGEGGADELSTPPPLRFARLYGGNRTMCGIREDTLGLACWGSRDSRLLAPPEGRFVTAGLGSDRACGIRDDGTLACWGVVQNQTDLPPPGRFRQVSVGRNSFCAVDEAGALACWGNPLGDTPRREVGAFAQVAVGWSHACALGTDGTLTCWGSREYGQTRAPTGRWLAVASRPFTSCALAPDGSVTCWGEVNRSWDVDLVSLSMSFGFHACGRTRAGPPACILADVDPALGGLFGEDSPPTPGWSDLSVGYRTVCGTDGTGLPRCHGPRVRDGVPEVPLARVVAGDDLACGLDTAGEITCWGWTDGADIDLVPEGPFVDLAVGNALACALDATGEATCWGLLATPPPAGPFVSLSAGDDLACALRVDGTIACWGLADRRLDVPEGRFRQVDVEGRSACALAEDRSVTCWGFGPYAPDDPGPWTDVSAAVGNACGLARTGRLTCWGRMAAGSILPPPDVDFVAVEGGGDTQCGLDVGGGLWCWGAMARQPLSPASVRP